MNAQIITIGDEILYGQIIDTNTQWIGQVLSDIGIRPRYKVSVGDQREDILEVLEEAQKKADVIIITGGLGPTKDDITKTTLADFFDDKLEMNPEALANVTMFFHRRGKELSKINESQAALPTKAYYLSNEVGTAPGMWFSEKGRIWVSLPGVPNEMKYLMRHRVIPKLKETFVLPLIQHQIIRTIGIGESFLAEKIAYWEEGLPKNTKLAYLPGYDGVKLRLTGHGTSQQKLEQIMDEQVTTLLQLIPEYYFGTGDNNLEQVIGELFLNNKLSLATAESCTGGNIAHLITSVAGSSAYFLGGIISYSNEVKINTLGVQTQILEEHGAVSETTAKAMAEGARKKLNSDYAIATTGIAGPDGGSETKPVGTVWIAVTGSKKTIVKKFVFSTERHVNIALASYHALNELRKLVLEDNPLKTEAL